MFSGINQQRQSTSTYCKPAVSAYMLWSKEACTSAVHFKLPCKEFNSATSCSVEPIPKQLNCESRMPPSGCGEANANQKNLKSLSAKVQYGVIFSQLGI